MYRHIPRGIDARRKFPAATGNERDLYRVDGLPGAIAQEFESKFMHSVDTDAAGALHKLAAADDSPWDDKMRSAWTRFILSLRYRNPEVVHTLKREMIDIWKAAVDNLNNDYDKCRGAMDPPTFETFMARTERESPNKAALKRLYNMIDNPRIGSAIFKMHWSRVPLAASNISLLTSDRPLDWPDGLASIEAYIALPIGPKTLFVAGRDDRWAKRIAAADPTEMVKAVNQAIVHRARRFVWGLDNSQLRFVQNRMSKVPDRPLITDASRQQALNAALGIS